MDWIVRLTCPNGHKQNIRYEGFSREWVMTQAELLDGSSSIYLHPPKIGDGGIFSKCAICLQQGIEVLITAEVIECSPN